MRQQGDGRGVWLPAGRFRSAAPKPWPARLDPFVPGPIRLSAAQETRDRPASLSASDIAARLDGRRILVAEDEVIVALELALELEDRGAEVVGPAHSLTDALTLALAGGIDAAILDVDLQGEEVFPVAERLMTQEVPLLFHTGHGSRRDLHARFDGAVVCIKPTLSENLVAQVARFFD